MCTNELLHPTGNIGLSIIQRVENARETDVCVGTTTSLGYMTIKFKEIKYLISIFTF